MVQEHGLAAQSGELLVGDVLTSVNDQPARGAEGAHRPALTRPALPCDPPCPDPHRTAAKMARKSSMDSSSLRGSSAPSAATWC